MKTKNYNLLKHIKRQNIYGTHTIPITATKFKKNDTLERIANELNIDISAVKVKVKNVRFYFSKEWQKSFKKI